MIPILEFRDVARAIDIAQGRRHRQGRPDDGEDGGWTVIHEQGESLASSRRLAVLALFATGCEKLKSRDHLNKGVQAFKTAKYTASGRALQRRRSELDPELPTARLYLATAYMSQYIPGAESPENHAECEGCRAGVPEGSGTGSKNTVAIGSLASLHYNEAQGNQPLGAEAEKLDEAKKWYTRLARSGSKQQGSLLQPGCDHLGQVVSGTDDRRAKLGMKPEDPGPIKDKKVREELKAKWRPIIEDGITQPEARASRSTLNTTTPWPT